MLLFKEKKLYNARYEFGLAIKANPEEPAFYYNLAYTYKMLKKPKKAQEALDMYNKLMTQQFNSKNIFLHALKRV